LRWAFKIAAGPIENANDFDAELQLYNDGSKQPPIPTCFIAVYGQGWMTVLIWADACLTDNAADVDAELQRYPNGSKQISEDLVQKYNAESARLLQAKQRMQLTLMQSCSHTWTDASSTYTQFLLRCI